MIQIEDLQFRYGPRSFELRVPQLVIERGRRVALVGPSGSGKTTLMYLIAGVLAPNGGRLRVGDAELSAMGDAARRNFRSRQVGLVFQDFELLEYLNVRDNILLPYFISRGLKLDDTVRQTAVQLADSMGLRDKLPRMVRTLSRGEQQRVAICRALLPGPDLLLADEPTGNLDPVATERILAILLERARQTGATLVVVTHDHSLLRHFDQTIDCAAFVRNTHDP